MCTGCVHGVAGGGPRPRRNFFPLFIADRRCVEIPVLQKSYVPSLRLAPPQTSSEAEFWWRQSRDQRGGIIQKLSESPALDVFYYYLRF